MITLSRKGKKPDGPIIFFCTGFRSYPELYKPLIENFLDISSNLYGIPLPQHGHAVDPDYERSFITKGILKEYIVELIPEIQSRLEGGEEEELRPIIFFGMSTGVTFSIKITNMLQKEQASLSSRIGIVGVAPAFKVDHNVGVILRNLAPIVGSYISGRLESVEVDIKCITRCPEIHDIFENDDLIDREPPFAKTLHTISELGKQSYKWLKKSGSVQKIMFHGKDDKIVEKPSYKKVENCTVHDLPGLHDPLLHIDRETRNKNIATVIGQIDRLAGVIVHTLKTEKTQAS